MLRDKHTKWPITLIIAQIFINHDENYIWSHLLYDYVVRCCGCEHQLRNQLSSQSQLWIMKYSSIESAEPARISSRQLKKTAFNETCQVQLSLQSISLESIINQSKWNWISARINYKTQPNRVSFPTLGLAITIFDESSVVHDVANLSQTTSQTATGEGGTFRPPTRFIPRVNSRRALRAISLGDTSSWAAQ